MDLGAERVIKIEEYAAPALPAGPRDGYGNNYHSRLVGLPWRHGLRPLHVVQPQGPSFSVDGWAVRWQGWNLRLSFNAREGLVLHDLSFEDPHCGGRARSVAHRCSIAELAVPYGDPRPPYNRKCALDAGDYGLGFAANSLALGCDCLGHIHYFDAVVNDAEGAPVCARVRRKDTLTDSHPAAQASPARSRTRCACTRRTWACCGSTWTTALAPRSRAARAAWSSASS